MFKRIWISIISFLSLILFLGSTSFTKANIGWEDDLSPQDIVDEIRTDSDIQETSLQWEFDPEDTWVRNTLESVSESVGSYIKWIMFIGMMWGTILIIYNGMLLVLNPNKDDISSKVKSRLKYIWGWVFVMLSVTLIIEIIVTVLWALGI